MFTEILEDGTKRLKLNPMADKPFYSDWLRILLTRGLAFERTSKIIDRKTNQPRIDIVPIDRDQEQLGLINDDGNFGIICGGCGKVMWSEMHDATHHISEVKLTRGGRLKKILGTNISTRFTDKIRIGGFVQMQEDSDPEMKNGYRTIITRWRIKFMAKNVLACEECRDRFRTIEADVSVQNEIAQAYHRLKLRAAKRENEAAIKIHVDEIKKAMQVKCLHGLASPFCAVCFGRYRKNPYFTEPILIDSAKEITPFLDVFSRDAMDTAIIRENI